MTQNNALGLRLSLNAGGDLTGTSTANTVVALQNRQMAAGTPSDQTLITWEAGSNQWQSASPPTYFSASGPQVKPVTTFTGSSYSVGTTEVSIVYTGSVNVTFNLPASSPKGRILYVSNNAFSSILTFNVTPHAGTTLNGSGSAINIGDNFMMLICYDGVNWATIGTY